uniref:ATP synthase complex subunit 8 n=1 Tax=Spilomantis occipitalis TaxID=2033309 RepID=A0A678PVW0_9NEOP|nr:ATP synthase F0 subunit 8 [Hapalopeza occipitalis]
MPQMMPLNWFMLFSLFSMILILFNMMNFYINLNKNSSETKYKLSMKSFNWKW